MQSSVAFDNEEKRTTLLRQARQVCLLALQRYDLDWSRVAFVQFSESVTYRITTTPDSHYLLRIHVNQDSPR
ncbi:hypothetical protein [Paenibacillus sp. 1P07SE]|uniref:hypothetical protein n=1 Tax=Paenibacillus sp. 1P07SE TaxID=3132209 RepID=UPI0039A5688C